MRLANQNPKTPREIPQCPSSRRGLPTGIPSGAKSKRTLLPVVDEEKTVEEEVFITNPVLVGAMHQTSKFDSKLEDDFEGANITLDMKTDRL